MSSLNYIISYASPEKLANLLPSLIAVDPSVLILACFVSVGILAILI